MKAGELDREVTLRRATVTKDEYNADVETWADLVTVWGSKKDISDGERIAAAATGASITTRFRIRYSADVAGVTPEDQLVCEGRTYNITGVKEVGRREGLEITATARADS